MKSKSSQTRSFPEAFAEAVTRALVRAVDDAVASAGLQARPTAPVRTRPARAKRSSAAPAVDDNFAASVVALEAQRVAMMQPAVIDDEPDFGDDSDDDTDDDDGHGSRLFSIPDKSSEFGPV